MIRKLLKKGIALEMAVSMMLTLFALSTLVFVITCRESMRDAYKNAYVSTTQKIEQIGNEFFTGISSNISDSIYGDELLEKIAINDVTISGKTLSTEYAYLSSIVKDKYTFQMYGKKTIDEILDDNGLVIQEETIINVLYLNVVIEVNKDTKTIKIVEWYINSPSNDSDFIDKFIEEGVAS